MWQIFATRRSAYWVADCWHQDDKLQTELLWQWWNSGLLSLIASTTGIESVSTLASSHLTTRLYQFQHHWLPGHSELPERTKVAP